jgi:hypothetical protein
MIQQLRTNCVTSRRRYTTRDALISAGVMLLSTVLITAAGIWASRSGHADVGEVLKSIAFPLSLLLSMPLALLKHQSRFSQAIVLGPTVLFIVLAAYIAVSI